MTLKNKKFTKKNKKFPKKTFPKKRFPKKTRNSQKFFPIKQEISKNTF
jgi:hypothetical protein